MSQCRISDTGTQVTIRVIESRYLPKKAVRILWHFFQIGIRFELEKFKIIAIMLCIPGLKLVDSLGSADEPTQTGQSALEPL